MFAEPFAPRRGPQALDRFAIARFALGTREMLQHVDLVLGGVIGQGRSTDRACCTDKRGHASAYFRIRRQRLHDVRRSLGIPDQHNQRRALCLRHCHQGITDLLRVVLCSGQRVDADVLGVIALGTQVRRGSRTRFQPRLEAVVADARHHHGNQMSFGRPKVNRRTGAGSFCTQTGKCFLAGPVVRKSRSALGHHGTEDLAKSCALVDYPCGCCGNQDQRIRIRRKRLQGLARAGSQEHAGSGNQDGISHGTRILAERLMRTILD